ncbi:MAG TPA: SDR family NAD(P)-dependent oxidoreductase [Myxococcales bacterium]|nr:SDR family NAD(P)-dependent oxidoreductase [Myxococcales bacterium]
MATRELADRSFLVTGASSGIGRSVLEELTARGASVVVATRSEAKTRPLLDDLRRRHPGADLLWLPLDLADLRSVAKAADVFLQSGRPLHVLINNAGVAGARGLTRDGFEVTVGTNHLGTFLLTERLLPRLHEAPAARVVNVASLAMRAVRGSIDWNHFFQPSVSARDRYRRYGLSKLFNVMHARELAKRLQGSRVTAYSLHPGVIASDVWRELPRPIQAVMKLFMGTNRDGAEKVLHCALAPGLEKSSGSFFHHLKEHRPNPLAEDDALCAELYRRSEELVAKALSAAAA